MSTVQRPGFTAKEKKRHTHGIIDGDFGRDGQVVIVEYTMRWIYRRMRLFTSLSCNELASASTLGPTAFLSVQACGTFNDKLSETYVNKDEDSLSLVSCQIHLS